MILFDLKSMLHVLLVLALALVIGTLLSAIPNDPDSGALSVGWGLPA